MDVRSELLERLQDFEDFAAMKQIQYPAIYIAGGSALVLEKVISRSTRDFDVIDQSYPSEMGRLLNVLGAFDLLDYELTAIPPDFKNRTIALKGFKNVYLLSPEDIIVSKLPRYDKKDISDIQACLKKANPSLLNKLISDVQDRADLSERVKEQFNINVKRFRSDFHV